MTEPPNQPTSTRGSARAGKSRGARNAAADDATATAHVPQGKPSTRPGGHYEWRYVNVAKPYTPKKWHKFHSGQPRPVPPPDAMERLATYEQEWNELMALQNARLAQLDHPLFKTWTFDTLGLHLRVRRRLRESSIHMTQTQLRFMGRHPIAPVRFNDGPLELVRSANLYLYARENIDDTGPKALHSDIHSLRRLFRMLQLPIDALPALPPWPQSDERWLPSPEQVYDLLHADYTVRANISYDNALVKALLLMSFPLGTRTYSEPSELRLEDHDPDEHTLIITEPKKHSRRRTLLLEPEWICCSSRHPSLDTYRKVWRRKVDPDEQRPEFFLRPDGTPFPNKLLMRQFVNSRVRLQFPWFNPYLGRHWTAAARLIEWDYDYVRVANWLGHSSVEMLRRSYDHNTRLYERTYGRNWLARIGRRPRQEPA